MAEVSVSYVTPGGVATREFAEGGAVMRVCLGYLHHPDDGLLAEMEAGRDPVPWETEAVRDEAMWAVRARGDLDDDLRRRLLRHVRRAPFYAPD